METDVNDYIRYYNQRRLHTADGVAHLSLYLFQ